ncbi:dihydrolipoamide acetyltransferase family protein [Paenibacillus cremeus]|uniref:Dihydrolipoamide acetyltransferase component of pyruvate dehydrogenase complex n=1 Tax=Paenibacillus cremeus TaxID=2163881 RepID=A0A559KI68_9BACL|nr:dihydrolipoamide acetyltransferase family protein [Paenibacillus cremeus]TVY11758.1 2-oxo acid dehydrogenase subunit E2 [Paenibacillus cremeus]
MQNEERGSEVTVPHLAESLVSAVVGKWLKQPGDYVHEYDVLCELLTDKVNVEMPSPLEGTLLRILVPEGARADVGAAICLIRQPEARAAEVAVPLPVVEASEPRQRYSPAVLHLAEKHHIDLRQLTGSGLGGRVTRRDVLAYIKQGMPRAERTTEQAQPVKPVSPMVSPPSPPSQPSQPSQPAHTPHSPHAQPPQHSPAQSPAYEPISLHEKTRASEPLTPYKAPSATTDQHLPITPLRHTIASRMRQSVHEIPHAWLVMEADVSRLALLRQKLKDDFARKEGVKLTFIPFVIKALVSAIKDYPMLNSTWSSDKITVKKEIHLSIAVGTEESVVTPVIKHADRKTIAGLAIELDDLVGRARSGKLTLADLQGGTFTFNNTGAFGSIVSYPIINYPQAAIMTFESIVRKPVALQDMIAIRSMVNLCLSFDHRILDGVVCGRFLQRVKHYLEQYDLESNIY